MNKKIKDAWVDALRSNNYKQGTKALKYDNTYCCLGVLCDLHAKATGGQWTESDTSKKAYYHDAGGCLPPLVRNWVSFTSLDTCELSELKLAELNDSGKSFEQIANLIEQSYEARD